MRRVLHVLGAVLLGVIALAALLVGGTLTLLRTDWGSALALRLALPRVNAAIAGKLEVGRFTFGGDRLIFHDVELRDPQGALVARVHTLDVTFSPLALFQGRVDVRRAEIDNPSLWLRQNGEGWNLPRALASRHPSPPPPPGTPKKKSSSALTFELDDLRVRGGALDVTEAGHGTPRHQVARASALTIDAQGRYETRPGTFAATVDLDASIQAPLRAPLSVHLSGHGSGARRDATAVASLGETTLAATVHGDDGRHLAVRLDHVHVTPKVVRALAPAVRLAVPVDVSGHASRDGDRVSFALDASGATGRIDARGTVDTAHRRVHDLSVTAKGIDLAGTIAGLPHSQLSLNLGAEGGGTKLADLDGHLDLQIPSGTLDGVAVAPSSVRVEATNGHVALQALLLTLPGLVARAHGTVSPAALDLTASMRATDLGRMSRAAAAFAPGVPRVTGRGMLAARITGTPAAPSVAVTASFPALAVGQNHVSGLKLSARVPDVRRSIVGEVHLQASDALVGGHTLRGVVANLRSAPPRLAGDLRVAGGTTVAFDVEGGWTPDHQGIDVRRLSFRYPRAAWRLTRPARIVFAGDHLAVSGLDLASGPQRLALDLDKRGSRLRAQARVARFELSSVPALLLPPGKNVAGRLDADVGVTGTLNAPEVDAEVHLRDGHVDGYGDLSLSLEGHYHDRRAEGTLDAAGLGTSVHARFDAPAVWPLAKARGPLDLDLDVPPTELAPLLATLKIRPPRPVAGRVRLDLHIAGSASAPTLAFDAAARALVVDGQAVGDVAVRVDGDTHAPLTLALALGPEASDGASLPVPWGAPAGGSGPGTPASGATAARLPPPTAPTHGIAAGTLLVRTELSLAALAAGAPSARELTHAHVDVKGDLRAISLAALARLAHRPKPWGGTAALRLSATGTALAPQGALDLRLSGASGPGFPATDARLDARAGAHDARLALHVARAGHLLGWATVIWQLPVARAGDRAALTRAPLDLTAGVGPLRVRHRALPGTGGPAGTEDLTADLLARLSVRGSLGEPQAVVSASVRDARLGAQPLGGAQATLTYAAGRARAEASFRSTSGGHLDVTGKATAELGYPQVTRLDAGAVPFDARLSAQGFDLGWLSGLNRTVRQVGGQLTANITATGTPHAPRVQGKLEWKHGTLMLTSLGSYHDVHLAAHGNQDGVWLDDLRLASADGDAHLTAGATRGTDGAYDLQASASLNRFPVYAQGQELATVSVDTHAQGIASARQAKAVAKISEAHVELNDVKQKKLQPLDRPDDVILMSGGKPASRADAKRLASWTAARTEQEQDEDEEGAAPEEPATPPFKLRLAVDAPRNLWVHGKDASLEIGLGSDFHVESAGKLAVYGKVLVRRGRIDVFGRRFDLQAGSSVQFEGPPDRPHLDVTAKYFNETENISVLLTASGTPDKLTIGVTSPERPDLTEGQLYTLIVTGRLQFGGNTAGSASPSSEAASLVGGVIASQLQKTLASKLPLDVLTLQAGEGGLSGSRLEAGTYLTSKLYAGYVGRVGANPALLQNRNAVHVEYQLTRRWSFDAEYGDVGTGTADLFWTKNY